jgi:hypothetical protein
MSHSTHGGFRAPSVTPSSRDTSTQSGSVPRALGDLAAPLNVLLSLEIGVGQNFTQRSKVTALFVCLFKTPVVFFRSMWSLAVGVGMLWLGDDPYPVP